MWLCRFTGKGRESAAKKWASSSSGTKSKVTDVHYFLQRWNSRRYDAYLVFC